MLVMNRNRLDGGDIFSRFDGFVRDKSDGDQRWRLNLLHKINLIYISSSGREAFRAFM